MTKASAISNDCFNSIIKLAADSVKKLRQSDVYRVLDSTPDKYKASVADRIKDARNDLTDEVNQVMKEVGS